MSELKFELFRFHLLVIVAVVFEMSRIFWLVFLLHYINESLIQCNFLVPGILIILLEGLHEHKAIIPFCLILEKSGKIENALI